MMTSVAVHLSKYGLRRMCLGADSCCMSGNGLDWVFQVLRQQEFWLVVCKAFF